MIFEDVASSAWENIWAPLAVGVALYIVAEAVRGMWRFSVVRRAETQARRARIVGGLAQAKNITFRAVRDGLYEESFLANSMQPLAETRRRYDDITEMTLALFREDEGLVAEWTAVEFYAGFLDPLYALEHLGVRAPDPEGFPLLPLEAEGSLSNGYVLPRPDMLLGWSKMKTKGPKYGNAETAGDATRHRIVPPNTDVNMDMIRPPVQTWKRERDFPNEWPSTDGNGLSA
jgi:hypothetical protein